MTIITALYFISLIYNFSCILNIIQILYVIGIIACFFGWLIYGTSGSTYEEDIIRKKEAWGFIKKYLGYWYIPIASIIISIFIPTEKTMYMMAASSYVADNPIAIKAQALLNHKLIVGRK